MPLLNPPLLDTALRKNAVSPAAVDALPILGELFGVSTATGYSAELVERVVEYQLSVGLSPDGVVSKETLHDLTHRGWLDGGSCASLWPALTSEARELGTHFIGLYERVAKVGQRPILLGIRGVYPGARRTHPTSHAQRYDDTFVLLVPRTAPFVFSGATHAYQIWSSRTADVNRDRLGDFGTLHTGSYTLTLGSGEPPEFAVKTAEGSALIPVRLDDDRARALHGAEPELAEIARRGLHTHGGAAAAANVLFQPGYETIEPGARRPFTSIACQTAPLSALRRLRSAGNVIDYALTTAYELLASPPTAHRVFAI